MISTASHLPHKVPQSDQILVPAGEHPTSPSQQLFQCCEKDVPRHIRNLYESNDLLDPLSSNSFQSGQQGNDGGLMESETIRGWQLYTGCRRQSRQNRVELKGVTWSVMVFRSGIIVTTVRARAPGGC